MKSFFSTLGAQHTDWQCCAVQLVWRAVVLGLWPMLAHAQMEGQTEEPLLLRLSVDLDTTRWKCPELGCSPATHATQTTQSSADTTGQIITLAQAYSHAMARDPALRAARAQVDSMAERLVQSGAQLKPKISLSANRTYNDVSQSAAIGNARQAEYLSGNVNLQMRVPIYRPALNTGVKISALQVLDSQALQDKETQAAGARMVDAYLQVVAAEGKTTLLNHQLNQAHRNIESAQMRLASGHGIRTDIDEWRAKADILSAQLMEASQSRQSALLLLQNITQESVSGVYPLNAAALDADPFPAHRASHWMDKAMQKSPEIQAMRARADAAEKEIERAKNGHLPTLDGQVLIGRNNGENISLPTNSVTNRQIGIQLDVPLYSGGSIQSAERQAVAEHIRAQAQLEVAQQDLLLKVQREWRNVTESAARIAALNQAVLSAEQVVISAQRSLTAGMRTVLDVVNAQAQAHQVRHDLFQTQVVHAGARLRLLGLVGKLDDAQIAKAQTWFATDERCCKSDP